MKSLQWVNSVTDISLLYESVWRVEMKARALSVTHRATDLRANALKRKYRIKRIVSQIHKFVNLHGRWSLTPQKMKVPAGHKKMSPNDFWKWGPSLLMSTTSCHKSCATHVMAVNFHKNHEKSEKMPPPGKSKFPCSQTRFWPLFVLFFFCTEGKKCVLDHFFWDFGHSPWPSKTRLFDTFFIKIEKWNLFWCDASAMLMMFLRFAWHTLLHF